MPHGPRALEQRVLSALIEAGSHSAKVAAASIGADVTRTRAPGTYGLLTTFAPSTPGIQGLAVFDTIEVTGFKKKTKKKGKKKRN